MEIEKPAVGFFSTFLVLLSQPHNPKTMYKLRRTWYKMAKIAQIKSAHLQPDHHFIESHVWHSSNTPNNTDTSYYDTDIPLLPDAYVSSFRGSGIGWLTMDASRPTLSSIDCWLISERKIWDTETRFIRRALMGEISVNFLIRWLSDQSINRDAGANRWPQIDGDGERWCLFQIPDINIQLSIDRSINRRGKWMEGKISRTADSGTHWKDRHKGRTNSTDGCKNIQNKIPKILAITIPTITAINIAFYQHTKEFSEGSIDRKGDVLTWHRT